MMPRQERSAVRAMAGILVLSFAVATFHTGFQPGDVLFQLGGAWTFLTEDFLPPDFRFTPVILESLAVTAALAAASASAAAVFAAGAAVLGSELLSPSKALAVSIRGLATFLRNIPTLVWAFILFSSLGVGTGVGFAALFITSFAFMTRAFIEVIDEIPPGAVESLAAVGASFWERVFQCVFPSCIAGFISWYLYCLEVNIRSSTVVGMVGGGGIGMVLLSYLKAFKYAEASGIILMIAVIVILVDRLTDFLRKKAAE